jgi:hypothetical protein
MSVASSPIQSQFLANTIVGQESIAISRKLIGPGSITRFIVDLLTILIPEPYRGRLKDWLYRILMFPRALFSWAFLFIRPLIVMIAITIGSTLLYFLGESWQTKVGAVVLIVIMIAYAVQRHRVWSASLKQWYYKTVVKTFQPMYWAFHISDMGDSMKLYRSMFAWSPSMDTYLIIIAAAYATNDLLDSPPVAEFWG